MVEILSEDVPISDVFFREKIPQFFDHWSSPSPNREATVS
jgi:hypothetical protein